MAAEVHESAHGVPNLVLIDRDHPPAVDRSGQHRDGPVALLVEVLSPSHEATDRVRDLHDHAAAGCPEHWVWSRRPAPESPWGRAVHVFTLVGDASVLDQVITGTAELDRWGITVDVEALLAG
ncbi:Uma2 family endonuclease [Kineococcus aurantiacus]|uniref:Uma2 family endonuclease n=1 Tax=Kineococcus aurantiacus TaxID=37633 RepID=A0A7Y9DP63_9ACTN|nr:Uma2 family endonuclease [Kineococcus aurantiacus]